MGRSHRFEGAGVPMASLFDAERRDEVSMTNFARSITGYFDQEISVATDAYFAGDVAP